MTLVSLFFGFLSHQSMAHGNSSSSLFSRSDCTMIFMRALLIGSLAIQTHWTHGLSTRHELKTGMTPTWMEGKFSRREALVAIGIGSTTPFTLQTAHADEAQEAPSSLLVPAKRSTLILGANGGTGKECVAQSILANRPCIATTRSGNFVGDTSSALLKTAACDVRSLDHLRQVIGEYQPGAVIFAASASSKKDLKASEIDKDGVINAAKVCLELNVPRYVVVSSGTVTRPDSLVYQLLNTVGSGIMEAKIEGEDAVRALYKDPSVLHKRVGYTIIRPGGLTDDEPGPASLLELNQGDSKSGRLSRASVAELCITCLDSADAFDTTFECYEKDTAKPIESIGLSNILKLRNPTNVMSGMERQGDSWEALFQGLQRDEGHDLA